MKMLIVEGHEFIKQIGRRRYQAPAVAVKSVREIVAAVKAEGDKAVIAYEKEFNTEPKSLMVSETVAQKAVLGIDKQLRSALELSLARIKDYHRQLPAPETRTAKVGKSEIIFKARPLERVGIYVPGGNASYPSTVIMTATLAQVAGVKEIVLCTPPGPTGWPHAVTLAAATICGVNKVFCCGGAQAIAAMAFGTETIEAVDKIVGPGNVFVTAAKKEVFGAVDIDGLAGPSEAMILLDPRVAAEVLNWCCWDLKAQAEHGLNSCCVLVTTNPEKAIQLAPQLKGVEGYIVICSNWDQALEIVESYAPEHLQLIGPGPESLAMKIKNAGAVFRGPLAAIAVGDYVAGPSHVLPTGGSARSFSGLWVGTFMKTYSVITIDPEEFPSLALAGSILADTEGFSCHAKSLILRRERLNIEGSKKN
jgi:histidinol dehydrogenase